MHIPLRTGEPDGGGGGGTLTPPNRGPSPVGGPSQQQMPNGQQPSGQGQQVAPEVQAEELSQIVSRHVAGAVSNYFRRGAIKDSLKEAIGDIVPNLIKQQIEAALADRDRDRDPDRDRDSADPDPPVRGKKGSQPQLASVEDHPFVRRLKERTEALEAQLNEQKKAAEEAKNRTQQQEERAVLTETLRKLGVDERHLRGAVAELYLDQKRVRRDPETGQIGFSMGRDWGEEVLPLEKGLGEWLKTEEGKIYLPPVQVQGSGGQAGGRPKPLGPNATKGDKLQALGSLLMNGGPTGTR
jgi:hypothetical protein